MSRIPWSIKRELQVCRSYGTWTIYFFISSLFLGCHALHTDLLIDRSCLRNCVPPSFGIFRGCIFCQLPVIRSDLRASTSPDDKTKYIFGHS